MRVLKQAKITYTNLIELIGFESEEEPNLNTADSPTDEEKVTGTCETLPTFLLNPELTKGASVPGSFDNGTFSKPNSEPDLVESCGGASAAVSSIDGTTLFPKLNRGGLATDPFGVVDWLKPKLVLEAAVIGLKIGSETDEVIEVGTSTFFSTLDQSAVLTWGLPSIVKLLDGISTDEPGGFSSTAVSTAEIVLSATAVETVVSFPEVEKGDTAPLGRASSSSSK